MWTVREAFKDDAQRLALIGRATFLETFAGILDGNAIMEHRERTNNAVAYKQYLERGARAWLAADAWSIGRLIPRRHTFPNNRQISAVFSSDNQEPFLPSLGSRSCDRMRR